MQGSQKRHRQHKQVLKFSWQRSQQRKCQQRKHQHEHSSEHLSDPQRHARSWSRHRASHCGQCHWFQHPVLFLTLSDRCSQRQQREWLQSLERQQSRQRFATWPCLDLRAGDIQLSVRVPPCFQGELVQSHQLQTLSHLISSWRCGGLLTCQTAETLQRFSLSPVSSLKSFSQSQRSCCLWGEEITWSVRGQPAQTEPRLPDTHQAQNFGGRCRGSLWKGGDVVVLWARWKPNAGAL